MKFHVADRVLIAEIAQMLREPPPENCEAYRCRALAAERRVKELESELARRTAEER